MHENGVQKNVQAIGYAVAIFSGANGSYETPENYRDFLHPYLSDPKAHGIDANYGVNKEFMMVEGNSHLSEKKHGIKHYDSAVGSLIELGNAIGRSQWKGDKSLTIGGDHSQGFPTVKVTLLVETLKAIKDGRIDPAAEDKTTLLKLADAGVFDKAGAELDKIVKNGGIKLSEIKAVTNKVSTIWIDAHGDYNTPEISPSGNFHGMSSAAAHGEKVGGIEKLFGECIAANPRNLYVLCERALDDEEKVLMKERGIHFGYHIKTSRDKSGPPMKKVLDEIINEITEKGNSFILSVDIDHLRAIRVPQTGTAVINGPDSKDSHDALDGKLHHPKCLAGDVTEIGTIKENKRGTETSEEGFKAIVVMTAGKKEINRIGNAMKRENIGSDFKARVMQGQTREKMEIS